MPHPNGTPTRQELEADARASITVNTYTENPSADAIVAAIRGNTSALLALGARIGELGEDLPNAGRGI